jgi:hypothetical protein
MLPSPTVSFKGGLLGICSSAVTNTCLCPATVVFICVTQLWSRNSAECVGQCVQGSSFLWMETPRPVHRGTVAVTSQKPSM